MVDEVGDVLELLPRVHVENTGDVLEEKGGCVVEASSTQGMGDDVGSLVIKSPHVADGGEGLTREAADDDGAVLHVCVGDGFGDVGVGAGFVLVREVVEGRVDGVFVEEVMEFTDSGVEVE